MTTKTTQRNQPRRSDSRRSDSHSRRFSFTWPAVVAIAALALPAAEAFQDGSDRGAFGRFAPSDPTVGTLPVVGGEPSVIDQTLAIRGAVDDVREAISDVALGNGARIETVDLGGGEVWVRFFGTLVVELDLGEVGDVEVEIFNGFDGGGMNYAVRSRGSFGELAWLGSGERIPVRAQRLASMGLFDEALSLRALHRSGQLTETSFATTETAGSPVLRVEQLVR